MLKNKSGLKIISLVLSLIIVAGLSAACGGGGSNAPSSQAPASQAPSSQAPASQAPGSQAPSAQAPGASASAQPDETIEKQMLKIGIITAFSGASARSAETQLLGMQVALNQIAESGFSKYYDFDLIIGDDMDDATEAVAVANKLVYQDGIKVAFGHLSTAVSLAGLTVYEEAKIPTFVPSSSAYLAMVQNRYKYAYQSEIPANLPAIALVDYLVKDVGITKMGMLYVNNEGGQAGLKLIEDALAMHGLKLAAGESYAFADTDYTGQMLSFKAAGCEAVAVWAGTAATRPTAVAQARQLIGPDVIVCGDTVFSGSSFVSATQPEERAGVVYPVAWSPAFTDDMSQRYIKEFIELDPLSQTPSTTTVRFYDAMYLLATALNNLGPYDVNAPDFTDKLNDSIRNSSFQGLMGLLKPDEFGLCVTQVCVVRYNSQGVEELLVVND